MWREILKALKEFGEKFDGNCVDPTDIGQYFVYHTPNYGRRLKIPQVVRILTENFNIKFGTPIDFDISLLKGKLVFYGLAKPLVKSDDPRHSPFLDEEDMRIYCTSNNTETELLRIDYATVKTVHLVVVMGSWYKDWGGRLHLYTSNDGTTWTRIHSEGVWTASEDISIIMFKNVTLRYLKMTMYVEKKKGKVYARLRKIIIVEA